MFTAIARSRDGALLQRVDVNGRHEITTDEPASLGGTDTAPAPHELLPAMLASCIGVTIAAYVRKHGWSIGELAVEVTYDNRSTPRHVTTTIHLPDGLTAEQIGRLERVAEACPVKRGLEAGFSFEPAIVSSGSRGGVLRAPV